MIRKSPAVLLALLLVFCAQPASPYTHSWSYGYGGPNSDYAFGVSVNTTGEVAVTGYFWDSIDLGGGPLNSVGSSDIFVARYNAAGGHVWSKSLGQAEIDGGQSVVIDESGAVVLTGYFSGTVDFGGGPLVSNGSTDIYLVKYGPTGAHLWSVTYGSSLGDGGIDVAFGPAGDLFLTGYLSGTTDFGGGPVSGPGGADIFLARMGGDGSHIWSVAQGGTGTDTGWKLAVADSGVVLTGYFTGTADFGGGPHTSAGGADVFLARYNSSGAHMWSSRFGGSLDDLPAGVGVDASGRVALTGSFQGAVDFGGGDLTSINGDDIFVAQFNSAGTHVWSNRYGGISKDKVNDLAIDGIDNIVITGGFPNTIDFGGGTLTKTGLYDEIYVAKFNASGSHVWSAKFGSDLDDGGRAVDTDGNNGIVVTGKHEEPVDFGGGPIAHNRFYDVFIARFSLSPTAPHDDATGFASQFVLHQNYPNPFNPATAIRYDVPSTGSFVTLRIYNVSGHLIRTLVDAFQSPGEKSVFWNGRDNSGMGAASGVYFYRLTAAGIDIKKRMVLLR